MKAMICALALLFAATPAKAETDRQSLPVKTADLNLATEKGQKALALRIHRAAKTLCESEAVEQLPSVKRNEQKCIAAAKARAIAAVQRKSEPRAASR